MSWTLDEVAKKLSDYITSRYKLIEYVVWWASLAQLLQTSDHAVMFMYTMDRWYLEYVNKYPDQGVNMYADESGVVFRKPEYLQEIGRIDFTQ